MPEIGKITRDETDAVAASLACLRVPVGQGEYSIHSLVEAQLEESGFSFSHEVTLGSRCRIDFTVGSVGIEIKRGRVDKKQLIQQLSRYLSHESLSSIVVVSEGKVDLPRKICGKEVRVICLMKLWGIAL